MFLIALISFVLLIFFKEKKLIFVSTNLLKIEKLLKNLIFLKIGKKKRIHINQISIANFNIII